MKSITLTMPLDMHLHLRDGEIGRVFEPAEGPLDREDAVDAGALGLARPARRDVEIRRRSIGPTGGEGRDVARPAH